MTITWSESDDESNGEISSKLMAFTRKYEYEEEFSDEDMYEEDLVETFILMHTRWKDACTTLDKQNKTINMLLKEKENLVLTIIGLEDEIYLLKGKLETMPEFVSMMNSSSDMLDDLLE